MNPADTVASDAVLESLRRQGISSLYPDQIKITVGRATCGLAAGADAVYQYLQEETAQRRLNLRVASTGCLGWCQQEPLVTVHVPGQPRLVYSRADEELAKSILDSISSGNLPSRRLVGKVYADEMLLTGQQISLTGKEDAGPVLDKVSFYASQLKIATRNCGFIDPGSIAEYAARDGYRALWKALRMQPEQVIDEIAASGLRGRGGGGYPTARKWQVTRRQPGDVKYIICNADEGDPGAYMDRSVLEGDPHTVSRG